MKKKLTKLSLKKETIARLNDEEMFNAKGGTGVNNPSMYCTIGYFTVGQCDFPTIGHDDGPYCLSKTDWGWCWCNGI